MCYRMKCILLVFHDTQLIEDINRSNVERIFVSYQIG